MYDALQRWLSHALSLLPSLPHKERLRSNRELLEHSIALAQRLWRYQDLALSQAGFLHSCAGDVFAAFHEIGTAERSSFRIEKDVRMILNSYGTLMGLDPRPGAERMLWREMLATREPRGGVLLVHDLLERVDPRGEVQAWTSEFHRTPSLPPQRVGFYACSPDGTSSKAMQTLLRRVASPVAEQLGLWAERNTLEDAALLLGDSTRAGSLTRFCVAQSVPGSISAQLVDCVQEKIGEMAVVSWEWRHASAVGIELGQSSEDQWIKHLGDIGYLCLIPASEEACYGLLGKIHREFLYRRDTVRDFIGQRTLGGYRALHTRLIIPSSNGIAPIEVNTRIIPPSIASTRFEQAPEWNVDKRSHAASSTIPVFAPDGQRFDLPQHSTVLEFAVNLHRNLIIQLKGARIDRTEVGMFHELRAGDVVYLDLSGPQKALPNDWESRIVDRASVAKIRDAYRAAYRPVLRERGYRFLSERLVRAGLVEVQSKESMTSIIEAVQHRVRNEPAKGRAVDGSWWLTQLGVLEAHLREERVPYPLEITEQQADELSTHLKQRITHDRIAFDFGLDFVSEESSRLHLCQSCGPDTRDVVVERRANGVFIHRPGAACAGAAQSVAWLASYLPQHFFVEGRERAGLAEDVAAVFSREGIGIAEIVGLRLNNSQSAIRVRISPVPDAVAQRLTSVLHQIDNVQFVRGPRDPISELEEFFPPRVRDVDGQKTPRSDPYPVGEWVRNNKQFYGREHELKFLQSHYASATSTEESGGAIVFVGGPLKTGKTSLVYAFQRERVVDRSCISLVLEAGEGEDWDAYAVRLCKHILKAAGDHARSSNNVPFEIPDVRDPIRAIEYVHEQLDVPLIVAIDEAPGLLKLSQGKQQLPRVSKFMTFARSKDNLMVILIGPTAPRRRFNPMMQHLLVKVPEIILEPMPIKDIRALIRAENFGYLTDVEESVIEAIYHDTAGNPYWANLIAADMWKLCGQEGGLLRYSRELLKKAKDRVLLSKRSSFAGRYRRQERPFALQLLTRSILLSAAGRLLGRLPGGPALSYDEIFAIANHNDISVTPQELSKLTLELENMGALVLSEHFVEGAVTKEARLSVSAPLLAEHLLSTNWPDCEI